MEARSTALTFCAYLTVALVLAAVCFIAILRYGLSPHLMPPDFLDATAAGDAKSVQKKIRAAEITLPPTTGIQTDDANVRQIQLLENLVDEKNQRLRQLSEESEKMTRELADLRDRYEEATAIAIEMLGPVPESSGDISAAEPTGTEPNTDPAKLEAELAVAEAVQKKLVADRESLQEELKKANQELSDLQMQMLTDAANNAIRESQLRTAMVSLFGSIGSPAVQPLIGSLNDASPSVRQWAAEALGKIGPDAGDAVPALKVALSDDNENVRKAARSALDLIAR